MSPEEARSLFLPLHGAVGLLALVGGVGALVTSRGSPRHRWFGLTFVVGMAGAVLAAIPVLVVTQNVFLTGMGGFAAYMTWTGWRIARQRSRAGGRLDQATSLLMILAGLGFAAWGLLKLLQGAGSLAIVPVLMGGGSVLFARQHLRWFRADPATRRPWIAEHLGAIGGGFIAGLTAFGAAAGTNLLPMVPEAVFWLGPAALLIPVLRRATARVPGMTG